MKLLYIDCETAPGIAYFWGLWDKFIPIERIIQSGHTLCFAAHWEGSDEIEFWSEHDHGHERMVQAAWELLDDADAVCHYNGKKFDIPVLNKEFVKMGLRPPVDFHNIDLYQVVKKQFRFDSNKLDFVLRELGLDLKLPNKGMSLWTKCMAGDDEAWAEMESYNIQDVEVLPKLYEVLRPWITNHPNRALFVDDEESLQEMDTLTCPACGSHNIRPNGTRKTAVMRYQRYLCGDCGKSSRGRKALERSGEGVLR